MRVSCIAFLLVSGISADDSGCAADLNEEIPLGDTTTLLQLGNLVSSWLGQDPQPSVKKKDCPVPCKMGDWGDWGACSETCGEGTRTRSREVAVEAQHGGACHDAKNVTEECKLKECPVPCTVSEWTPWSACSATCGDGTKTRSRTVTDEAKHGGACDDDLEESKDCKEKDCPVPCTLSDWGDWSVCSKTCGEGTKTRSRTVTADAQHGGKCDDAKEASENCKEKECPIPCTVSEWEDWTTCSATCGDGTKTRSRTMTADAQHGGECPALEQSEGCIDKKCPIPCKLSDWGDWSKCSKTCGEGTKTRSRTVTAEAQHGGKCDEAKEASEECKEKECPIPCIVSDWDDWSACSATCGDGTKTRSRSVTSQAQHGGACDDDLEASKDCKDKYCPKPCTLSDWGDWSKCDKDCGPGTRTRSRTVTAEAQHGGECDDATEATEKCKKKECPVPCEVSEWDDWSACSATCGKGTKTRSRTITADAQHGGACDYELTASKECEDVKCPIPCTLSDWGDWSKCSKTCGEGTKTRSRTVTADAQHGGKCDEAKEASEDCKEKECPIPCTVSEWEKWSYCSATCGDGTKTRKRTVEIEAQHGGTCEELEESNVCRDKDCPVPCTLSDWGDWSVCSKTCDEGSRTRSRTVTADAQHGGTCDDAKEASEECKEKDCPIPCTLSDWKDWTACSATCGDGTKTRTRTVTVEAQHGGTCGKVKESEDCKDKDCPVPCTLSDWGDWSVCSKTCDEGSRTRSRTVTADAQHGGKCDEAKEASEACKEKDCPIPCTVSQWDDWSACSATCGDGTKTRTRTITADAQHGGTCEKLKESEDCKDKDCPVPCTLSDWGDWSKCSKTCGEGSRTRSRTVTADAQHGGKCDEAKEASEECKEKECPIPCTVSDWDDWTACSATCGGLGTKTRSRTVTADAQHGGKCDQELTASEECNTNPCPVPCTLCDWEDWTPCSATCGQGTRTRKREVTIPAQHGGKCDKPKEESERCKEKDCPNGPDPTVAPVSKDFKVCGKVKNVNDNSAVPGAKVTIADLETVSNATGGFCIEKVPAGAAALTSTKDGWVDTNMELKPIITKDTKDILVPMSKKLAAKDWKIILTWGKTPLDLDARTEFGVLSEPTKCVVSYQPAQRSATCPQNGIEAKLDQDHCFFSDEKNMYGKRKHSCVENGSLPGGPSDEPKPETTTLTNVDPDKCGNDCTIVFHVSNYMGSCLYNTLVSNPSKDYCSTTSPDKDTGTIGASEAEVRVIHGDKEVAFFQLAKEDGFRKWPNKQYEEWWVFSIDVKTSKVNACTSGDGTCV